MVVGNSKGTKRSKRISSGRKKIKELSSVNSLNKIQLPVKADPMPQKLFDNRMDIELECRGNSKDMSEVTSEELEQMVQFNAAASRNQQAEGNIDSCKIEEIFVEKPPPLSMDPNALAREEEDIHKPMIEIIQYGRNQLEKIPARGKEFVSKKYAQLKASIKKLQVENSMTCRKIVEMSESSVQLRKENRRLLKQLKKTCTPDTIAYLEAQNPVKKSGQPGNI